VLGRREQLARVVQTEPGHHVTGLDREVRCQQQRLGGARAGRGHGPHEVAGLQVADRDLTGGCRDARVGREALGKIRRARATHDDARVLGLAPAHREQRSDTTADHARGETATIVVRRISATA
jgi:hypothetical protein